MIFSVLDGKVNQFVIECKLFYYKL